MTGCGAPEQSGGTAVADDQVVVTGKVTAGSKVLPGAYVRLLDGSGEFAAEVATSTEGDFRFYAAPGEWTVRALHRDGTGEAAVTTGGPGVHAVNIAVQ